MLFNTRTSLIIKIFLILFVFTSCGIRNNYNKPENFKKFHRKIYRDTVFHYSRINYPLKIYERASITRDYPKGDTRPRNKLYSYTQKTLPRAVISFKKYPEEYELHINSLNEKKVEKIYSPRFGYEETRFFILKNNRWYMDSIRILND